MASMTLVEGSASLTVSRLPGASRSERGASAVAKLPASACQHLAGYRPRQSRSEVLPPGAVPPRAYGGGPLGSSARRRSCRGHHQRVQLKSQLLGQSLQWAPTAPFQVEAVGGGGPGGALVSEANIFERVARLVRSWLNAAVSQQEDPERLLDQAVLDMNTDLQRVRATAGQVIASQRQLERRYSVAHSAVEQWYGRARLALARGEENLAKQALAQKKLEEQKVAVLKQQLDKQTGIASKLLANTRLLESKIQEAVGKKEQLKARALAARSTQEVQAMLKGLDTGKALAAYQRIEEQVVAMEAEAEASEELITADLDQKFAALEVQSAADSDLEALRRDLQKGTRNALPTGAPTEGRRWQDSFTSMEVEAELEELRRQTR